MLRLTPPILRVRSLAIAVVAFVGVTWLVTGCASSSATDWAQTAPSLPQVNRSGEVVHLSAWPDVPAATLVD